MKKITDPDFVYRDSAHTNIRATFARIRREQKEAAERQARADAERAQKVRPMKAKR